MLASLADVVHDRQRADSHEHNRDEENDQEVLHIDLAPLAAQRRIFVVSECLAHRSCGYLGLKRFR